MENKPILLAIVAPLILIAARTGAANDLKPETLKAWDDAVQATKSQLEQRVATQQKPFLWIDEVSGRAARVRAGQIVVAPANNGSPLGFLKSVVMPDGRVIQISAGNPND